VALIVAMVVALWCGEASAQTSTAEEDEALRAAEAELAGKSHYEVLGVATDATPDELKRAFHKLSRTLHPDKVRPGAGVAERAAAHARFLRTVEGSPSLSVVSAHARTSDACNVC
jgi:DnaJ-domain-containing protein 1